MSFVSEERSKELDRLWEEQELNRLRKRVPSDEELKEINRKRGFFETMEDGVDAILGDRDIDYNKLSPVSEGVQKELDNKFLGYIEDLKADPLSTAIRTADNTLKTMYSNLMDMKDKPIGVAEVALTMTTGLFGALPGMVGGAIAEADDTPDTKYFDAFHHIQSFYTWEPKTESGQEMMGWVEGVYNKWIEEGYRGTVMDQYVDDLVKTGRIHDPHERAVAGFLAALPDAVMMFAPFAPKLRGKPSPYTYDPGVGGPQPRPAMAGEYIPGGPGAQKGGPPARRGNVYNMERGPALPAPMLDYQTGRIGRDQRAIETNVRQLLDQGRPIEDVLKQIEHAKDAKEAVSIMEDMRQSPPNGTIFKTFEDQYGRPMTTNDFGVVTKGRWTTLVRMKDTGETATIPTSEWLAMVEAGARQDVNKLDIEGRVGLVRFEGEQARTVESQRRQATVEGLEEFMREEPSGVPYGEKAIPAAANTTYGVSKKPLYEVLGEANNSEVAGKPYKKQHLQDLARILGLRTTGTKLDLGAAIKKHYEWNYGRYQKPKESEKPKTPLDEIDTPKIVEQARSAKEKAKSSPAKTLDEVTPYEVNGKGPFFWRGEMDGSWVVLQKGKQKVHIKPKDLKEWKQEIEEAKLLTKKERKEVDKIRDEYVGFSDFELAEIIAAEKDASKYLTKKEIDRVHEEVFMPEGIKYEEPLDNGLVGEYAAALDDAISEKLWAEENKKIEDAGVTTTPHAKYLGKLRKNVERLKKDANTPEKKQAVQNASKYNKKPSTAEELESWLNVYEKTIDNLKDFEDDPFIRMEVVEEAAVDSIAASAPGHIRDGVNHFGDIAGYVQALTAELAKWEKVNLEALNEIGPEAALREFGPDLPGFVRDVNTAAKILEKEKPYRIIALNERIRQSIEFATEKGIKIKSDKPGDFISAIFNSAIMADVRSIAKGELFKPRNANEAYWRDLPQDKLARLLYELDQGTDLMYYGAAEKAKKMSLEEARDFVDEFNLPVNGNKRVVLQRLKDNAPRIRKEINRELRARERLNLTKLRPTKDEVPASTVRQISEELQQMEKWVDSATDKRFIMADHILHKGETLARKELMQGSIADLREIAKEFSSPKGRSKEAIVDSMIKQAKSMRDMPGYDEHVAKLKIAKELKDSRALSKIFPRQSGQINLPAIGAAAASLFRGPAYFSKSLAQLVHITSRALFTKHITEVRRLNSSTAKRFAEYMLPHDVSWLSQKPPKTTAEIIARPHLAAIQQRRGWFETVRIEQARWIGSVDNILEPHRKGLMAFRNWESTKDMRLSMMHPQDSYFIKLALQGDRSRLPARLNPVVDQLRGLLDEFMIYLVDSDRATLDPRAQQALDRIYQAGLQNDPAYAQRIRQLKLYGSNMYQPDYFPHLWDANKIAKDRQGFLDYLEAPPPIGEGIRRLAERERILRQLEGPDGFLEFVESTNNRFKKGDEFSDWQARVGQHPGHASVPGPLMQRVLNGNSEWAQKYQVTDIEAILNSYFYRGVLAAEYTRAFGRGEWKLNRMVRDIILEEDAMNNVDRTVPVRSPKMIAADVYDLVDAAQHRYGVIQNPYLRSLERSARSFTVVRYLGLVGLAQVPEYAVPLLLHRGTLTPSMLRGTPLEWIKVPGMAYIEGTAALAKDFASWLSSVPTGQRKISEPALKKHLQRVSLAGYGAMESAAARWTGPLGVMSSRFITAVGMEHMTRHQRMIAMATLEGVLYDNSAWLSKALSKRQDVLIPRNRMTKKEREYRKELEEMGIPPQAAIDWYRRGGSFDDPAFIDNIDTARFRDVSRTIIEPLPGNIPKWINSQKTALVWLFSRFFSVFGNTIGYKFLKNLGSKDVRIGGKGISIAVAATMVMEAYYINFLREVFSGYQLRDEDDPMRWFDAYDRAGFTGGGARLYHLISPYKYAGGQRAITAFLGPFYGGILPDMVEVGQALFSDQPGVAAQKIVANTPLLTIHGPTQEEASKELEKALEDWTEAIRDMQEKLGIVNDTGAGGY